MSTPLHGAIRLPDGTLVRGRGLKGRLPDGPSPHYGLYLVGRLRRRRRREPGWEADWVVWPPAGPSWTDHP